MKHGGSVKWTCLGCIMDRVEILSPSLESHFRILYQRQKLRGKSLSQVKNHLIQIRHFERFLGRTATIDDLTDEMVGDVMQSLIDRGRRPRTANKFRDCICALWSFLARKGLIMRGDPPRPIYPDVMPFDVPEDPPVAWTREQLVRLWEACENQQGSVACIPWSLWLHAIHAVIWDTGERIGALLALEWADVDIDGLTVTLRARTRKGKRRGITRGLHPDTGALLAQLGDDRHGRVFPWPHDVGTLYNRYTRILRNAGLPRDRAHKFHCMRKSVASYYEAAGGNATVLLDHSSRRVTDRYLDPRITGCVSAAPLLFRPSED